MTRTCVYAFSYKLVESRISKLCALLGLSAGTNYIETLRVQIHANCRIRRIYFSDRLYSEEELPPEFKLFLPIQVRRLLSSNPEP